MSARSTDPMRDTRSAREAHLFVDMLQFSRLVVLYGEEGAGKTRLLKDWVISALRGDAATGKSRHIVYFDAWSDAPLAALTAQIEAELPAEVVKSADTPLLRHGPWIDRLAAWTERSGRTLLLIFDHFERYLALPSGEGADAFAREWIASLAAPDLPVQFLVALRSAAEPLLMERFGRQVAALGDNRLVLPPPPRRRAAGERRDVPDKVPGRQTVPVASIVVHGVDRLAPAHAAEPETIVTREPRDDAATVLGLHALQIEPDRRVAAPARAPVDPPPPRAPVDPPRPRPSMDPSPRRPPVDRPPPREPVDLSRPYAHLRAEPRFGPATRPPPPQFDDSDDDLFGPEPEARKEPASRTPGFGRRMARFGAMFIGVVAAMFLSALFLLPPDDFRIPLRARLAASAPPAAMPAPQPSLPQAPLPKSPSTQSAAPQSTSPQSAAPQSAAPQSTSPQPASPQPASPQPPLPQLASPESASSPVPLPPLPQSPTPQSPAQQPPAPPPSQANLAPPVKSDSPPSALVSDATPHAPLTGVEADAATVMARDLGSVLAAARPGGGALNIRAGLGATAATGPRPASGLFIARYDVLDAMRSLDSIDGLRLLAPLQVEPIYFAVRHDEPISFVHEIAGRRINLGAGGTDAAVGSARLYQRLFDAPVGSQRVSYMPDVEALPALVRERSVDVVILVGRAGYSALAAQQRATPDAFKLLVFDPRNPASQRALRSYLSVELPPVAGNPWLSQRLPALGVMSFLVARGIDDDRAGRIVRELCHQRGRLRSTGHPYWLAVGFTPVNAPGWRFAASAERELRACAARSSSTAGRSDAPAFPVVSRLEPEQGKTRRR